MQAALDNAVAALGDLVEYHSAALGGDAERVADTWICCLPLKQDATEAIRVHQQLLDALKRVIYPAAAAAAAARAAAARAAAAAAARAAAARAAAAAAAVAAHAAASVVALAAILAAAVA